MDATLLQILSALVGASVVYVFGIRQLSIQRRNAFIEKQLSEFYSPIAGYRKRIRTKSELRLKISTAADEVWREICECDRKSAVPIQSDNGRFTPFRKVIEYDNQQFRNELMPLYRKMLDVFTEKYWLADSDTRAHYQSFLEFVELWERFLADSIPVEVITKLGHAEKNVHGFYEHLESRITALQAEVKDQRFLPRL
jgi:hypothetical protein